MLEGPVGGGTQVGARGLVPGCLWDISLQQKEKKKVQSVL